MRILDKDNNEIQNPDYDKGYLTNETIVIKHHDAIEANPGKSHLEVIKEYDNGGKDVVEVWDEKPTEAKDAWDETEQIYRYTLYTAEQLEQMAKEKEEAKNKETKLNSLYTADMTFSDLVDTVAGLLYGGAK
jgi:hypothetical protein